MFKINWKQLDKYIGFVALWLLLGTIIIQVFLRFFLSKPLMGAEEFTRFMVICIVLYPLSFTELSNSQIVMEDLQQRLPGKLPSIVHWIADITTTVAYIIVAVSAIMVVINNPGNKTATLGIPFWFFFLPAIIGFIGLIIAKIVKMIIAVKGN